MSTAAPPAWTETPRIPDRAADRSTLGGVYVAAAFVVAIGFALWHALVLGAALSLAPNNDFGRFYLSTQAFWAGGDMYAWNPATPAKLPSPVDGKIHMVDLWNMNPPHFHLLLLPLAFLPARAALAVWTFGGLAALVASTRIIIRELGLESRPEVRQFLLIALLAGVATPVTLITGQVSWYLLLPVTLVWRHARRGQWEQAGLWLGLVAAWKPFLLIFLPYLVVKRRWRALAAAAVTAALSYAVGFAVFGVESHRSWLACIDQAENWAWLQINAGLWGFLTRCGTANPLYVPWVEWPAESLKPAWLAGSGLIGLVTFAVALTDRSPVRIDRAFALLLTAAFLICPLGWNYYWFLAMGPVIAVLLAGREDGLRDRGVGSRCERFLLGIAVLGWFAPVFVTWFLPGPLTTTTTGSVYFWATLSLWSVLVIGGWRHVAVRSAAVEGVTP